MTDELGFLSRVSVYLQNFSCLLAVQRLIDSCGISELYTRALTGTARVSFHLYVSAQIQSAAILMRKKKEDYNSIIRCALTDCQKVNLYPLFLPIIFLWWQSKKDSNCPVYERALSIPALFWWQSQRHAWRNYLAWFMQIPLVVVTARRVKRWWFFFFLTLMLFSRLKLNGNDEREIRKKQNVLKNILQIFSRWWWWW